MNHLNRAMRRHPELEWLGRTYGEIIDGTPLVAPVPDVFTPAVVVTVTRQQRRLQARMQAKEAGALPLAAYPSRRLKRIQARKRAQEAAKRSGSGGVA